MDRNTFRKIQIKDRHRKDQREREQTERQTERKTDKQKERQTNRKKDRKTDRQTDVTLFFSRTGFYACEEVKEKNQALH